jgi:uncharacterized protein YfbU (UPF0304 family)
MLLKEKKIINKDRITFTVFPIKKKATLLSLLRSFFIYKKAFEQFGKQTKQFNFFLNKFKQIIIFINLCYFKFIFIVKI